MVLYVYIFFFEKYEILTISYLPEYKTSFQICSILENKAGRHQVPFYLHVARQVLLHA